MHRDTLKEILKSKSMSFSAEEIEEMMNEELDKFPEEMDTELVDLCAQVLEKVYFAANEQNLKANKPNKNNIKSIKIRKVILVAAIVAIFACASTMMIGAKYFNIDASEKIVKFVGDYFDLNLRNGKTEANKYSDENNALVKYFKKQLDIENIILPSIFLSDEYEIKGTDIQDGEGILWVGVHITNETTNFSGYIDLMKAKSPQFIFGLGQGHISKEFDRVKQLTINGMDIIVFGNDKRAFIDYVDNNTEYEISLHCDFDTAVEIANSIEQ